MRAAARLGLLRVDKSGAAYANYRGLFISP